MNASHVTPATERQNGCVVRGGPTHRHAPTAQRHNPLTQSGMHMNLAFTPPPVTVTVRVFYVRSFLCGPAVRSVYVRKISLLKIK